MRWKQEKPLWPTLLALSCLFILAMNATRSWQGAAPQQSTRIVKSAAKPAPQTSEQQPETILLPPPPGEFAIADPNSNPIDLMDPESSASELALDSSLTDPLPSYEDFEIETLLEMRDLLLSVVDQWQEKLPTSEAPVAYDPHRVRVNSSNDRLAMLDKPAPRPRILLQERAAPTLEDFAKELLHPSSSPKKILQESPKTPQQPRVALAPPALTLEEPTATESAPIAVQAPRLAMLPRLPKIEPSVEQTPVVEEQIPVVESPSDHSIVTTPEKTGPNPETIEAAQPELALTPPVKKEVPTLAEPQPETYVTLEPIPLQEPRVAMRHKRSPKPSPQPTTVEVPQVVTLPAALRTSPQLLIEQLQAVAEKPSPNNDWAIGALTLVNELADDSQTTPIDPIAIVSQLAELADTGISVSDPILQPVDLETAWALHRRVGVWKVLLDDSAAVPSAEDAPSTKYASSIRPLLNQIYPLLQSHPNGEQWQEYLKLDSLAASTSAGYSGDASGRRELVQSILARMKDSRLTEQQQAFLATKPLAQLNRELQPWAAGPVNLELLDALVERYEKGRETRYAVAIAKLARRLEWSADARSQELAKHLDRHYRGANMRIAVTDDLMNRMIPKQKAIVSPVRERIAGSKVRGHSRTVSEARVRLVPDNDSWRFSLEAFGKVYSETQSDTWPARVQNAAKMTFEARKTIVVSDEGLKVSPAKAKAEGRNHLKGVESELDPVPLIGYLLRDIARQKHNSSRSLALKQVKSKVAREARQRMDKETNPKIVNLEQKFHDHVLVPLSKLALLAEPMDMHTTNKRAVMQVRLANQEQLAAHTQRPFAPSDSLLSMQMHETALNNAIARLGLDGQKMTVPELYEYFAQRFGLKDTAPPADIPDRATIEFAERDAIRLHCEGDRIELILSIKQLGKGRDKIKNFEAHAFFRPIVKGLEVTLVRDGTLQFKGRRLKTGPRVVLHSVLGKLLRKDQELSLIRGELENDPRMAGIMVTQLEIENGWIAVALGPNHPQRSAWRKPEQRMQSPAYIR